MFKLACEITEPPADVKAFTSLIDQPPAALKDLFRGDETIYLARAPGRLDVMGGIADYSGSLMMPMPIAEATIAAVQIDTEPAIRVVSLESGSAMRFEIRLSELFEFSGYDAIRERFQQNRGDAWAAYVVGVLYVLCHERSVRFANGMTILITSAIPVGKGVSSSAALEVAVMHAVCAAFQIDLEPLEKALLCQQAENLVVGSPCGVMDQIATTCGEANKLLRIRCQPAEVRGSVEIPASVKFWGIDSGVRHAVSGADYGAVRVGAFMGYRIIADLAGLVAKRIGDRLVKLNDNRWNGYLCNVTVDEYETVFQKLMPLEMNGREFLNKYQGTTDPVTKISPDLTYAVRIPTEHAIYENDRVARFSQLIEGPCGKKELEELGSLMYQAHAGYAACGLTEGRTERLVQLARESREKGIYGARITGGGSGGTVLFLAASDGDQAVLEVAKQFGLETGMSPHIFSGSSPGCSISGTWEVRRA